MRCPHCSAEQPHGVTVCGFCGAFMLRGESPYRPAATRAAAAQARRRRWLLLVAVALALGLAGGWAVWRAETRREPPLAGGVGEAAPGASGSPSGGERVAPEAGAAHFEVVRESRDERMTEERLTKLAERVALLAEGGRARELAALVDPRASYRSVMEELAERRELAGGKPELLAHWLAPWMAAEREGSAVDQQIEVQSVRLGEDPRQGWIVRRLETRGDVTRVPYPRDLLVTLAMRGAVAPRSLEDLDLSPLLDSLDRCVASETLRAVATPLGVRIVEAERIGTCRP